jgi:protein gp37
MKDSKIEWCDHTFNPWEGCTKVSPGCANCYAEARNKRWAGGANWGPGAPRRRTSEANWRQPLKWDRLGREQVICLTCDTWHTSVNWLAIGRNGHPNTATCKKCGSVQPMVCRRPRVFCASLADWLDDEVPIEWLADLLDLIGRTPNLDWLPLTKRPENWRARMEEICEIDGDSIAWSWLRGNAPDNVWIGTTVENQKRADERIPELLKIPARVRFLSCEPLLGSVNLGLLRSPAGGRGYIDWVICGGESGPKARPMHPDWARSLRDQCQAAGVPFLFKQWGEWLPACQYQPGTFDRTHEKAQHTFDADNHSWWVGKKAAGRMLDGREWSQFPEVKL